MVALVLLSFLVEVRHGHTLESGQELSVTNVCRLTAWVGRSLLLFLLSPPWLCHSGFRGQASVQPSSRPLMVGNGGTRIPLLSESW